MSILLYENLKNRINFERGGIIICGGNVEFLFSSGKSWIPQSNFIAICIPSHLIWFPHAGFFFPLISWGIHFSIYFSKCFPCLWFCLPVKPLTRIKICPIFYYNLDSYFVVALTNTVEFFSIL